MKAENLVLDDSREWQVLEYFSEQFPDGLGSILLQAFIIEPV